MINNLKVEEINRPLCNIHTVSIASENEIVLPPELGNAWVEVQHRLNTETNKHMYIAKINTHKWRDELSFSYGRFQSDMLEIIQAIGLEDYSLSRVDFALNFLDDNYDELHKLNKCICLLLGVSNNLINRYESKDPLTLDNLTIGLQSQYIECENYNKKIQSNNWSPIANRLEFRSKSILKINKDVPVLAGDWLKRLDNAILSFDRLQNMCNEALIRKWEEENGRMVKTTAEFLRKYQSNIFTTNQLERFFVRFGKNPKSGIKSFKRYNSGIDFFTKKDLLCYIEILKEAVKEYFSDAIDYAILAPKRKLKNTA